MGLLGWRRLVGASLCLLVMAAAGTTATGLQPYNDTVEYTHLDLEQTDVTNAALPYRCDFESENEDDKLCGMSTHFMLGIKKKRNYYPSNPWWKLSDASVSVPEKAAAGEHFAYINSTDRSEELKSLETPQLIFNSSNMCVSFAYYISNDTASLTVRFMSSDTDSFDEKLLPDKGDWSVYNETVEAESLKYIRFSPSISNTKGIVAIDHLSVEQCAPTTSAPTRATTTPRQSGSGKTVSPGSPTESETTSGSYNTENTPSEGPERRDGLSPLAVGAIVSGMIVAGLLLAIVVLMIVLFRPKPPATTEEAAELNSEPSATDLASGAGGE